MKRAPSVARALLAAELIRAAREGPLATLARVERALSAVGFTATRVGAHPSEAALFSRGSPTVAFSGHVDVVPVGHGWTRDPFGGEVADGRVWGRGACDMLGSVAAFVEAARLAPEAPCAILLTTDEETTMRAAQLAIDRGLVRGLRGIVVGEPTGMQVGIAEKGVLWARVDATGVNAHGSMPELGDNAVERILRIGARIAGHGRGQAREHPLLGRATMSLDRIGGGDAVNQVPASAFLEADLRYLPGTTQDEALAPLRAACASEGARARVSVLSSHLPFETAPDAPLAKAALAAVAAEGRDARAIGLPYGTEASKFAPAGIPTVILGPGEAGLAHTDHESILLADLDAGARVYARLLRSLS